MQDIMTHTTKLLTMKNERGKLKKYLGDRNQFVLNFNKVMVIVN